MAHVRELLSTSAPVGEMRCASLLWAPYFSEHGAKHVRVSPGLCERLSFEGILT